MRKKNIIPSYVKRLIKKRPEILSGRKNISSHHQRIIDTIIIVKKYFKIKD